MNPAENDAGLEARYHVRKNNDPTGKHDDCRYFVLDPRHDLYALQALKYYARLVKGAGYTQLADDLDRWTQDETERAIAPRVTPPEPHEHDQASADPHDGDAFTCQCGYSAEFVVLDDGLPGEWVNTTRVFPPEVGER